MACTFLSATGVMSHGRHREVRFVSCGVIFCDTSSVSLPHADAKTKVGENFRNTEEGVRKYWYMIREKCHYSTDSVANKDVVMIAGESPIPLE